ncbi:hypothetical protein Psi02_58170 [Planotetraspora silvatica]|uniref:Uncharacterized protein n=1 Tax=Planotetraspora silvatica TaxID=234614 RepID=A0A8J3UNY1_9ACTN|nr:hypothetical protein Psi02_58170 [Planotetraspora silvatica]
MDRHVLHEVEVLDGHRDPEQGRQVAGLLAHDPCLLFTRLLECPIGGEGDECAYGAVEPSGTFQVVLGDLHRGQFPRSYGCRLLEGGKIMNVRHATER